MEIQDFCIWANWGKVPKDKKILIDLTDHEHDRINAVLNWAKENDDALWTEQLLAPNNIGWFLLVLDQSHVKGRKLKAVKKPSFKKRVASPPSSEAPKKCLHQTKGEAPTIHPIEDAQGATVDVGPNIAIDSGVELTLERETSSVEGEMTSISPMLIPLPTSPNLEDLDEPMG